jgi:hypothetical protein
MDPRAAAYAAGARNIPSLSMPDTSGVGRTPQAAAYEQRRLQAQIPEAPEQKPIEQVRRMPEPASKPAAPMDNRADRSRPLDPVKGDAKRWKMDALREHGKSNIKSGQYVKNKDGSFSTVRSITVEDSRLNGGKPTLIPTIWYGFRLTAERAIERAVRSKKSWPAFDTIEEAAEAAKQLSQELDAELRRQDVRTSR